MPICQSRVVYAHCEPGGRHIKKIKVSKFIIVTALLLGGFALLYLVLPTSLEVLGKQIDAWDRHRKTEQDYQIASKRNGSKIDKDGYVWDSKLPGWWKPGSDGIRIVRGKR